MPDLCNGTNQGSVLNRLTFFTSLKSISGRKSIVSFGIKKYLAYRTTNLIRKNCKIEHTNAYKCFSCSHIFFNFFSKKRFENHIKNDSGVPGSLYKFENQNFITFEDNYKFIGDLLFAVYFDFETTTTAKGGYNSEVCEMYSISFFYNLCIPSKIEQG